MKIKYLIIACCSFLLISCKSEPSLQKYFVQNTEDANFISFDISPSILIGDNQKLTDSEQKALESFEKMNILAFKLDTTNLSIYEKEKASLEEILKNDQYQFLMKFGSGKEGVAVSYIGTEEKVEEIIVYAKSTETGFAVARILGNKMTPTDMMHFVGIIQKSNLNLEQFKPLKEMIPNKK